MERIMFTFFPSPLRSTLACPSGLVKWKDFGDKTGGTLLWNSGIPLEAKWENAESGTKMFSRASSLSQVTLRISLELAQRNLRWGAWIHLKYCLAAFTQPWSGVWNSRAKSSSIDSLLFCPWSLALKAFSNRVFLRHSSRAYELKDKGGKVCFCNPSPKE